jgi:DNA-binding beta-propeller fold protein YncE
MINVTNGRIEHSWAVPLGPRVLGTNKIGNRLVALDPDAGKVVLIPVYDRRVVSVVDLSGARYAVFDPRERLLVAHNAKVAIINATGQHTAELIADPTDGPITHLATDPGGEYVFAVQRGVLSIFDLRNEKRAAVLRLPAPLGRVVPSADSQFALLPVGGHALSIISNWTLQESHRIEVGGPPVSVGLMLFQSVAAIAVEPGHRLFLYDLQHRHPLANLRLPGTPEFGASPSNGTTYYVALSDTGQVAVVDLSEHMSLRSIDGVGRGAWAVVPAIGDAYCH